MVIYLTIITNNEDFSIQILKTMLKVDFSVNKDFAQNKIFKKYKKKTKVFLINKKRKKKFTVILCHNQKY